MFSSIGSTSESVSRARAPEPEFEEYTRESDCPSPSLLQYSLSLESLPRNTSFADPSRAAIQQGLYTKTVQRCGSSEQSFPLRTETVKGATRDAHLASQRWRQTLCSRRCPLTIPLLSCRGLKDQRHLLDSPPWVIAANMRDKQQVSKCGDKESSCIQDQGQAIGPIH
jgi:hypothetical protein